ncbi:hypothetical protein BDW74DRAFT_123872 [Aspergillus multicolor]|uniref:uncharacterized protein n=1 Tax=Aspergillus multicolor TaxID=41759 RepID=UPI003CCCF2A0
MDTFEHWVLLSLRGPVLFEGLFNPNIGLSPTDWKDLIGSELDTQMPKQRILHCLSRVPGILHRVRNVDVDRDPSINTNTTIQDTSQQESMASLAPLKIELRGLYSTARSIGDQFHSRLCEVEAPGALNVVAATAPIGKVISPVMLHAHYQRTYAFAIIAALYLNYTLMAMTTAKAMRAGDRNDSTDAALLQRDAVLLALDMLIIAETAVVYRPMGAIYLLLGLSAARMAVELLVLR